MTMGNKMTYIAVIADTGPYCGDWVVIRIFDGALWSEGVKEGSIEAKQIIDTLHTVLTITDAAPTLEIKKPKVKK